MDTGSSAHGAGVAASSSSSQSSNRWKYDVFLSFRGDDTRNTFTDHLFIALLKAGINTSIDYHLKRGANIQSELDQKIEGSRIVVIVFSKRYAESRWCLRELSKIMRCLKDQKGKIVCPIFYDVDPSQVRKQKDSFGEAFQTHEKDEDPNEVKKWREDLKASADLVGWDLKTTADGREGVFIEIIVWDIMGLLETRDLKEAKHLFRMAFRVPEFSNEYLDIGGSPDVQIIGNRGMDGIGKTMSDLPNSLLLPKANCCTALEIMSDISEMSKMRVLELKDCRNKAMPYESDDDAQLDIRHVFVCYKTHEAWPWCINGSESDQLPKFFTSARKAHKNDITFKMSMTVIEGHEGTEFSDGDVLIFPQMIKYRGLKESDLDSFVEDVLVNRKPWASGVQEPLTGPYVFICARMSQEEWYRYYAPSLIDKFKQEAELQGLMDHVFVTACFHIGGHMYPGNLIIYRISSDGSITSHWYPFATSGDVPELLDEHIGKEIIERHWRGQIRASSDEAKEINDRELPNGEENKKIVYKPQENSNQIHQEKGNQIENSENGESEEKLKETRESNS